MPSNPPKKTRTASAAEREAIEITLEWLQARVKVDEHGCWVWQGHITKYGQPQVRITVAPYVAASMMVRRLVAKMKFKPSQVFRVASTFMRKRQAGVMPDCSWGCCRPEHVVMRYKKTAMRPTVGRPRSMQHRLKISQARRRNSKISDETIRLILADPRPGSVVARELGLHPKYPSRVRKGALRQFSAMGMFTGLRGGQ